MPASNNGVADLFLQIVPQVMRVITGDVRRSKPEVEPIYIHLLGLLSKRHRSLGELADMFSVSAPTMSNTISTLEARTWVERRRSKKDRRIVLVHLTPEGRSVLSEARAYIVSRLAEALGELDDQQREQLMTGLMVLREAFSHALPDDEDPA